MFMTGDFKEFKAESHLNDSWDEQNAMNSTAVCLYVLKKCARICFLVVSPPETTIVLVQDYLASIDSGGQSSSTLKYVICIDS